MGEAPDSDSEHDDTDGEGETTAVDDGSYADDNYVRRVLAKEKPLPPITLANLHKNINVVSTLALTVVPALSIYGALTTELKWQTALWAVLYYFYTVRSLPVLAHSDSVTDDFRRRTACYTGSWVRFPPFSFPSFSLLSPRLILTVLARLPV